MVRETVAMDTRMRAATGGYRSVGGTIGIFDCFIVVQEEREITATSDEKYLNRE